MAARYVCKVCGAESPTGIGYAVTVPGPLPASAVSCTNSHAYAETPMERMRRMEENTCAVCHERVVKEESGEWTHAHGIGPDARQCGTGDGSVAYPRRLSIPLALTLMGA